MLNQCSTDFFDGGEEYPDESDPVSISKLYNFIYWIGRGNTSPTHIPRGRQGYTSATASLSSSRERVNPTTSSLGKMPNLPLQNRWNKLNQDNTKMDGTSLTKDPPDGKMPSRTVINKPMLMPRAQQSQQIQKGFQLLDLVLAICKAQPKPKQKYRPSLSTCKSLEFPSYSSLGRNTMRWYSSW